eukprot:CAMPEP_0117418390 /NCGR_PEP_ID=MMETSP0758-20121206/185_1 /TAXON_ID=63605 /ORGANISM="Percolomonas cosmopolitus, Strain AE-1 (ATCC 50343)" /LENGTH=198 /DNA_ID=CAMNT_0005198873 /DNA_START=2030 /DNA_END=2626 /DNA_ORIENTATION=-
MNSICMSITNPHTSDSNPNQELDYAAQFSLDSLKNQSLLYMIKDGVSAISSQYETMSTDPSTIAHPCQIFIFSLEALFIFETNGVLTTYPQASWHRVPGQPKFILSLPLKGNESNLIRVLPLPSSSDVAFVDYVQLSETAKGAQFKFKFSSPELRDDFVNEITNVLETDKINTESRELPSKTQVIDERNDDIMVDVEV